MNELGDSFLFTWFILSTLGLVAVFAMSGTVFLNYYAKPDFKQWQRKINPEYPQPSKIREEILQTIKGLWVATICPALSIYLSQHGKTNSFCGMPKGYDATYLVAQFFLTWIVSDFYEFFYHYLGHSFKVR